tara:strand:+ start:331 stop:1221 length:891 start_codon:yes stop_codon:yes gene_type:complete
MGNSYLYWSTTLNPTERILGQPNPRVTGLSRTLLIFFVLLFFSIERFNKVIKILAYIIMFYIAFVLYGMQTRGFVIGLTIFLFIYLFFVYDLLLIKIVKILLLIILPIILYENFIANKKITNKQSLNLRLENSRIFDGGNIKVDTSGRIELWKLSLKLIKDNKIIFGVGPQGDRQIFNFKKKKNNKPLEDQVIRWSTNVSNGYIYSYLSAGILGFCIALVVTIILIKEVFVAVFINKIFRKNTDQNYLSIFCIIFLCVRTLFENGIFYFSVDYILILVSYLNIYVFNNNLRNNIIK